MRTTFDEAPELYDRTRPICPAQVFDDLVALARLREGASLVEIGCGTGQATLPLAERGFEIVCVELGERLAAYARGKLAASPNVEIINATRRRRACGRGAQRTDRVVVAVPAARRPSELIAEAADELVCPMTPAPFRGVGRWYDDFTPTTDEEVRGLLA